MIKNYKKERLLMKVERMIKILLILQFGETITTPMLAKELEVSDRTVHRDIESLSKAGVPVYSERGKNGGWRLVDDWKHKLSWLKEKEVLSFFLPHAEKVLSDLNLDISREDLRKKLLLGLPEHSRKSAMNLWERIYIDLGTWRNTEASPTPNINVLQQAVMSDQIVIITYKKTNGESKEIKIRPLGLVAKGNTWYIIALNYNGEYRNYKVGRIMNATLLDEYFERPNSLILSKYWEESKKAFIQNLPEFEVKVSTSPTVVKRIMFTGRFVSYSQSEIVKE
jgi:predicted DNA-binding transcriptional regulator YafY